MPTDRDTALDWMVNVELPHDPWVRNLCVGMIMCIIGGPILLDRLGTLTYSSATGFRDPKLSVRSEDA
jgi:hypothetical protein